MRFWGVVIGRNSKWDSCKLIIQRKIARDKKSERKYLEIRSDFRLETFDKIILMRDFSIIIPYERK